MLTIGRLVPRIVHWDWWPLLFSWLANATLPIESILKDFLHQVQRAADGSLGSGAAQANSFSYRDEYFVVMVLLDKLSQCSLNTSGMTPKLPSIIKTKNVYSDHWDSVERLNGGKMNEKAFSLTALSFHQFKTHQHIYCRHKKTQRNASGWKARWKAFKMSCLRPKYV